MIYVDGAVRRPGNYPIKKNMNIPEAIIAAGGLGVAAEQDAITLVRSREGGGKPDIVKFTMNDLQEDAGHNIQVKDRDIIFVGTNTAAAIFTNLGLMGPFGGVSMNYNSNR